MVAPLVAAVDVGGTRVKAALVDPDGREAVATTGPTPPGLDRPGALVDLVATTVDVLRSQWSGPGTPDVGACGLVVPGIVDDARGVAVWSANLGWRELDVVGPLGERLGLPVAIGHDVRAGLVAEATWGAARGQRHVLFLPVGTGIAGALMLDGHVLVADGWSGELGHVVVEPGGPVCGCGGRGCLEAVASAAAVERTYAGRRAASGHSDPQPVDAEEVARRVVAGDQDAGVAWAQAVQGLARGVAMAVSATGVDHVVVGGGLAQSGDLLLEPLRRAVHDALTFQREPRVVPAELGERAGCLGAAALARGLL